MDELLLTVGGTWPPEERLGVKRLPLTPLGAALEGGGPETVVVLGALERGEELWPLTPFTVAG